MPDSNVTPPQSSETVSEQLTPTDRHQFIDVAPLYDLLMTGVPYDDWVAYLRQLLTTWGAHPTEVLDLACGTGNVTFLLAQEGYHVTGVDIAPDMIAVARKKAEAFGLSIPFHVQDAAELSLPGQTFDLCVSLFDSLNYITEPARLARAMQRVAQHLRPEGLFIFDLNSEFALKNNFFAQNNRNTNERLLYDWNSVYFPETRLCRVDMEFSYQEEDGTKRSFEETHWQFAYQVEEILEMLSEAGFEDIASYQAYTLRPPTRVADRIYYVARRA